MEATVSGNCETLYKTSTLPENQLILNDDGEFIKITKTRNHINCDQSKIYTPASTTDEADDVDNMKPNLSQRDEEEVSSIIVSGSLQSYTIQSSVVSQSISVNGEKSAHKVVNVTLDSVEQNPQIQYASGDELMDVGGLVLTSNLPSDVVMSDVPAIQFHSGDHQKCSQWSGFSERALSSRESLLWIVIYFCRLNFPDNGVEYKKSNCWMGWYSGHHICKHDLGPEYVPDHWRACGIRYYYVCKKKCKFDLVDA